MTDAQSTKSDLDRPVWGARAIAEICGILDENGEPDEARAFYLLQKGLLPGRKVGRAWVSTFRKLRRVLT